MAEQADKESKTEQATEKKISDALEKGNVPFSREMPVFSGILALLVVFGLFLSENVSRLGEVLQKFVDQSAGWSLRTGPDAMQLLELVATETMVFLLPTVGLLAVAGLAASLVQNRPRLVLNRIKPQTSRLSIAKGWKRIFGVQGLVEFAKADRIN